MNLLESEPVLKNNFEVDFHFEDLTEEDNKLLSEQIIKIKKNKMFFNLNLVEGKIQPRDIIDKSKRGIVKISLMNRANKVIFQKNYKGFQFVKLLNLTSNLDYTKIKSLIFKVKFIWDSYEIQ